MHYQIKKTDTMIENEIKKIVSNYDGLSYINAEDSGEGTLIGVSVNYIDTLKFNKEQYDLWVDMLDSVDVIRPTFQIYCSYDTSGYQYWKDIMEENNHTYIDIWVSDEFSDDNFTSLINELDKIIDMIDNFLNENNL